MMQMLNKISLLQITKLAILGIFLLSMPYWGAKLPVATERAEAIIKAQNPSLSDSVSRRMAAAVTAHADTTGLDPLLILAVMKVESQFRPHVVSHAGAIGLLQIKHVAAKEVAKQFGVDYRSRDELFDPVTNIKIGAHYLAYLSKLFHADTVRMLTAYNQGPTRTRHLKNADSDYSRKVLKAFHQLSQSGV